MAFMQVTDTKKKLDVTLFRVYRRFAPTNPRERLLLSDWKNSGEGWPTTDGSARGGKSKLGGLLDQLLILTSHDRQITRICSDTLGIFPWCYAMRMRRKRFLHRAFQVPKNQTN